MNFRERLQLNLGRHVWIGIGAGSIAILALALLAMNQFSVRHRQARLERENAQLRTEQFAVQLQSAGRQFIGLTRDLAQSDLIGQVLSDRSAPTGRGALLDEVKGVDGLLVVDATQTVRLSAVQRAGRWTEQAADQRIKSFLDAAVARGSDSHGAVFGMIDDHWLVASPVAARASQIALGWLITEKQAATATLGAALQVRELQPQQFPKGTLALAALPTSDGFNVIAQAAGDGLPGKVTLQDETGNALRVFEVTSRDEAGSSRGSVGYIFAAFLVIVAGAAALIFALKRYVSHRQSVDGRYKALIDQANDGIVIVDAVSYKVLYANPAFLGRLSYGAEEVASLSLLDVFADGETGGEALLARLKSSHSQMAMNLQLRCKNGSLTDTEVRCNSLDVDGRDVLAYVTHDVSLRRKAEQQLLENQQRLDRMAHHDQLTGLPNRHYLSAFLPQAIAEAKGSANMLGVVFLDLDRFKHINDTRGHETGDKLLQEVAGRLRACVRDSDVVIRMGGDEFVVVFRNVKSYEEVTQGAARIVEALNSPIVIDRHPLQTTGSVGVSMYPRDGADMVELLKHSDTAMYQAKDRGRNNVQMFSHVMNKKLKQRVAVEASLREALRLKQLDVHYQPFVNLLTRKIVGLEALMRWNHPTHGMVPPDQFIPVAEETGLIVPMGNFVLHRTLQTMAAWRRAGASLVQVSLNVAPSQLQRGELLSTMSALLRTHAIKPSLIQLEMTERAIFDSHATASESRENSMAKLRDLGIKIAIDDFGTGYSSLSYLKNWRVDALKIDRSFVRDLVTDSSDLAIVSAIIAIAKHLQIQVIAEGIEGYQQSEILRRLGCSVGQGFLFARPMTASQVFKLLRENTEPARDEEEDMLAAFSVGGS